MAKHGKDDVVEGGSQPFATKVESEEVKKSVELVQKGQVEHNHQMEQHNNQMEQLTLAINALVVQTTHKNLDAGEPSNRFSSYKGNYEPHLTPPVVISSPASIARSTGLFMHDGGIPASPVQNSVSFSAAKITENASASRHLGEEGLGSSPLFLVLLSTQVLPLLPHPIGHSGQGHNVSYGNIQCPIQARTGLPIWATRVTSSPTFQEIAHMEMEEPSGHLVSRGNQDNYNYRAFARGSKLDFPEFSGDRVDAWIKKANKYFEISKVPFNQRVEIAVLYLVGRAKIWWAGSGINLDSLS